MPRTSDPLKPCTTSLRAWLLQYHNSPQSSQLQQSAYRLTTPTTDPSASRLPPSNLNLHYPNVSQSTQNAAPTSPHPNPSHIHPQPPRSRLLPRQCQYQCLVFTINIKIDIDNTSFQNGIGIDTHSLSPTFFTLPRSQCTATHSNTGYEDEIISEETVRGLQTGATEGEGVYHL